MRFTQSGNIEHNGIAIQETNNLVKDQNPTLFSADGPSTGPGSVYSGSKVAALQKRNLRNNFMTLKQGDGRSSTAISGNASTFVSGSYRAPVDPRAGNGSKTRAVATAGVVDDPNNNQRNTRQGMHQTNPQALKIRKHGNFGHIPNKQFEMPEMPRTPHSQQRQVILQARPTDGVRESIGERATAAISNADGGPMPAAVAQYFTPGTYGGKRAQVLQNLKLRTTNLG